jgi:hypothetical protein
MYERFIYICLFLCHYRINARRNLIDYFDRVRREVSNSLFTLCNVGKCMFFFSVNFNALEVCVSTTGNIFHKIFIIKDTYIALILV